MTALPPTARETAKYTYKIMRVTMQAEHPLTFSDGERIVKVLEAEPPLTRNLQDWRLTVLVELP